MKTPPIFSLVILASSFWAHAATNINPAQTLTDEIKSTGEIDSFDFVATAGETVAVLMGQTGGTSSFDPLVELRGPDGRLVAQATGFDSAYLDPMKLGNTGSYQIRCRDARNLFTAAFAVTLVKFPGPNPPDTDGGSLVHGQTKTGQIALGDLDTFDFAIARSANVQITMRQTSGTSHFDPSVELYGPDGVIIASASALDSATISECLSRPGTYLILCRDAHVSFDAGYDLSLQVHPNRPVPLPSNDPDNPSLGVFRCRNDIILEWLTNAVGFRLESASEIPSTNWNLVAESPQAVDERFSVVQPITAGNRFFRLRRP